MPTSQTLQDLIDRYLSGNAPASTTLAHLLIAADHSGAVAATLAEAHRWVDADPARRELLDSLEHLHHAHPGAHAVVHSVLAAVRHDLDAGRLSAETIAAMFDRAAAVSPEASVAVYSFGDAGRLSAATAEVVAHLRASGAVAPGRRLLEIGCGIGRFAEALAPDLEVYVGIDVSARMIEIAGARCAGLPNVGFERRAGHDLSPFSDRTFDTVLAVDSWPYVVALGDEITAATFAEAARVLRSRGDLVVLNWSYRCDLDEDRTDAEALAARHGLHLRGAERACFRLWDGTVFHFQAR